MNDTRTVGDHGTTETFTLGGAGLNLAGATGVAHIRRPDGTTIHRDVTIDGAEASYAWEPGDLSVAGSYTIEVQITYSNGAVQTFAKQPNGGGNWINVDAQLD